MEKVLDSSQQRLENQESNAPPAKIPKKNYPKILDGKFFNLMSDKDGSLTVECTLCNAIVQGTTSSTGNFHSHYKRKHKDKVNKLKEHLKSVVVLTKQSSQPTLNDALNTLTSDKTASLILNFIVNENLAFNVAQSKTLHELLEGISGRKIKMPKRHSFMTCLDKEFNKVKDTLRSKLKEQKYVCVTADVWSSRAQSFLGVTVHYINKDFCRESYVLAFKNLQQRQTYKELGTALDEIFNEYGLKKSQITNIVTDGGSSFAKMFKMYGSSIDVVVSTYDDDNEELDYEEKDPAEDLRDEAESNDIVTQFMEDANGDYFVNEIINFNEARDEDMVQNNYNENGQDDTDINDVYFDGIGRLNYICFLIGDEKVE
ncbi:uncharacterized protein LOC129570909 [Sitodiplosis mosellana]|uniref:uncharacterized protein LOC129570909 n=1 Tax=Sitodiplosis mosellana TaxID=263140 RepID=UPI002444BAB1|nr:uncharacterized protein LOC129570909 [Sitodiplosis mosellana]